MKVQLSIDDGLMAKVDEVSSAMHISRSGYFSMAVSQQLQSWEMVNAIKMMSFAIKKVADTGVLDDETRHQLEDFERLVRMIVPVK